MAAEAVDMAIAAVMEIAPAVDTSKFILQIFKYTLIKRQQTGATDSDVLN